MNPDQYCQQKIRHSHSSFHYPLLFLPKKQRQAMYALYAFCREVDDIVDLGKTPDISRIKIAWWQKEIIDTYAGRPHHPIALALDTVIKNYHIPQPLFLKILHGMEMDLNKNRYKNIEELLHYCDHVAVAVGEIAMHIFLPPQTHPLVQATLTHDFAHHLGLALQLTNILRDIAEDAKMDRIYLPQDLLCQESVPEATIQNGIFHTSLERVLMALGERAQQHYQQTWQLTNQFNDKRPLLPALIMARLYHTILNQLQQHHFNPFTPISSLTTFARLRIAWQTWVALRRPTFYIQ
ncbi:MAG: presqualene diphosphate synthase HpnD [Magnetococcus sp. DMHC-6]